MVSRTQKLGLMGLIFASLLGCGGESTSPNVIEAQLSGITNLNCILNYYHKGIKKESNDKDWDGDGKKDFYVVAGDGTVFYTASSKYPPKTRRELFNPTFYKHKENQNNSK